MNEFDSFRQHLYIVSKSPYIRENLVCDLQILFERFIKHRKFPQEIIHMVSQVGSQMCFPEYGDIHPLKYYSSNNEELLKNQTLFTLKLEGTQYTCTSVQSGLEYVLWQNGVLK
jgi:hypothetical protein